MVGYGEEMRESGGGGGWSVTGVKEEVGVVVACCEEEKKERNPRDGIIKKCLIKSPYELNKGIHKTFQSKI